MKKIEKEKLVQALMQGKEKLKPLDENTANKFLQALSSAIDYQIVETQDNPSPVRFYQKENVRTISLGFIPMTRLASVVSSATGIGRQEALKYIEMLDKDIFEPALSREGVSTETVQVTGFGTFDLSGPDDELNYVPEVFKPEDVE